MKTRPPSRPAPPVQAVDRLLHDTEIRLDTRLRDLERENAIARASAGTRFDELALLTRRLNETRAQAERHEAELRSRHAAELTEIRAGAERREAEIAATHAAALAQAETLRADQATQYQARLAEQRDRAERAEARLAALQSSRSWRLTAPLRALSGLSRR